MNMNCQFRTFPISRSTAKKPFASVWVKQLLLLPIETQTFGRGLRERESTMVPSTCISLDGSIVGVGAGVGVGVGAAVGFGVGAGVPSPLPLPVPLPEPPPAVPPPVV